MQGDRLRSLDLLVIDEISMVRAEILAPYYNNVYFFGSHVLQKTSYLCVELDHVYRQHDASEPRQ